MSNRSNDPLWLNEETTITRAQLGEIIANEIDCVLDGARMIGDKELFKFLQDLLLEFSASIAAEVFKDFDEDIEEEIR